MVVPPTRVGRAIVAMMWMVAMVWSSATIAEIYKWVDQKGVTNYSSAPPANSNARTLDPEAVTVSVYQAPQEAPRALDSTMRQRVAMLENQLQAERLARLSQEASFSTDADRYRLAYEQCVMERRVDCDTGRDSTYASPYFYVAAAPVIMVGRPFPLTPRAALMPLTPFTPFTRAPPAVLSTMVGFHQRAGGSTRTTGRKGLSRKF